MIIEISVGIIALAFLFLVIFLIKTLITANATLKQSRLSLLHLEKETKALSEESQTMLTSLNSLLLDIKDKSEALNFLFRPLQSLSKASHGNKRQMDHTHTKTEDIAEWIASSIILYKTLTGKER